jgi:hypothetical protein
MEDDLIGDDRSCVIAAFDRRLPELLGELPDDTATRLQRTIFAAFSLAEAGMNADVAKTLLRAFEQAGGNQKTLDLGWRLIARMEQRLALNPDEL